MASVGATCSTAAEQRRSASLRAEDLAGPPQLAQLRAEVLGLVGEGEDPALGLEPLVDVPQDEGVERAPCSSKSESVASAGKWRRRQPRSERPPGIQSVRSAVGPRAKLGRQRRELRRVLGGEQPP